MDKDTKLAFLREARKEIGRATKEATTVEELTAIYKINSQNSSETWEVVTDQNTEEEIVTEKKSTVKPKEYLINGDNYFPNTVAERSGSLPAGAYECGVTMEGAPYFKPITIVTDTIVDLEDSAAVEVTAEINKFWSAGVSEKFQQYGLVHKRGVLLAGPPGCGKTITLARVANMVINQLQGITLFNPNPGMLKEFLRLIKDIEPNKKVLVMWEEFDSILRDDESELLSLLDGETQTGNIVFLATTNYLSRIPARIKNRPSRFARVIEVTVPSAAVREQFLRAKLHESDVHLIPGLLQYSEGFVIDQFKDLIISVCCFGQGIAVAAKKINEMQENSVGVDDYNEKQASDIFASGKTTGRVKSPLQPIR